MGHVNPIQSRIPIWFSLSLILGAASSPCTAQGFDIGVSYARTQVMVHHNESKGPGLHGAIDFNDMGRAKLQFCFGYERLETARTTTDMANLGIQFEIWSPRQEGQAVLALEGRAERLYDTPGNSTYGRIWLRGGLGFRGIILPLFPFKSAVLVTGSERIVPFTRIEYSVPITKRDLPGFTTPSWELRLQMGLRFNLD